MRSIAIAVAGLLVTAGCGSDGSAGRSGSSGSGVPEEDRTADLVHVATIGEGSDGPEEELFGSVGSVLIGPAGDLFVADRMAGIVRRFDDRGTFLNSLGRRGEGPGEFMAPFALAFEGGRLEVWDASLWRVSTFRPDGTFLETERVAPRGETGWMPSIAPVEGGGWLYLDQEIESPADDGVELRAGIIRGEAKLFLWDPASEEWRQVGRFPGMEAALTESGGTLGLSNAPFPRSPLWAPADGSSYWYADSGSYRILRLGFDGDTLAEIAVSREGDPVSNEAWADFVGGGSGDLSTPAARSLAALPRPDRLPVLGHLLVSDAGEVWVGLRSAGTENGSGIRPEQEWHVYDENGVPRFRLRLPGNLDLRAVRGRTLVAVSTDDLDVQRIELVRLEEESGAGG